MCMFLFGLVEEVYGSILLMVNIKSLVLVVFDETYYFYWSKQHMSNVTTKIL